MKNILFLFIFSFFYLYVFGQNMATRQFATQEVMTRLKATYTNYDSNLEQIEQHIQSYQDSLQSFNVPIVFHILYATGQSYPDVAQINSQIDALNRDFNKLIPDILHEADTLEGFVNLAANIDISFCLAQYDPSGNPTTGIQFVQTSISQWTDDDVIKTDTINGVRPWDTDQYLNIWVAHLVDSVSGYAQMPGGPSNTDGIVIDYRFFGTQGTAIAPYDEGKTLTHLIGNYLSLYDLWNKKMPCLDDKVSDTPIHNSPNMGCPTYKHITTCPGYQAEMIMNYMDNTYDACMYMFTVGQKSRMRAVLSSEGPRFNLGNSSTLCNNTSLSFIPDITEPNTYSENGFPSIHIYPNPAKDIITIDINRNQEGALNLQLVDITGKPLFNYRQALSPKVKQLKIDSKNWPSGVYVVKAKIGETVLTNRIIVAKK